MLLNIRFGQKSNSLDENQCESDVSEQDQIEGVTQRRVSVKVVPPFVSVGVRVGALSRS